MKEKKPFVANKNHFYIFFGLFLCLLSVVLCLNTYIVARVLSTPFTYIFGSLSYLLYLGVNVLGLRLIFIKKFFKFKFNIYVLATLVLFVAASMFYAHFVLINNGQFVTLLTDSEKGTTGFIEAYHNIYNFTTAQGETYWSITFLSLFSHPFASGIIGYFLIGACNALFGINNGGFIIAIVIAVIALLLYFLPLILRLVGQTKVKPEKNVKEKDETISDTSEQKQNQQKVKNIDVVKHASEIDPDNYESEIMGVPKRSATMSSPTFVQQDSGANNFSISDNGMFAPAVFRTDNGQHNQEM